jgi:two-component system sensor histidine kinase UhpB
LLVGCDDHAVVLTVVDDGQGMSAGDLQSSNGVAGMRERALLAGASLQITDHAPTGTEVRLTVPVR